MSGRGRGPGRPRLTQEQKDANQRERDERAAREKLLQRRTVHQGAAAAQRARKMSGQTNYSTPPSGADVVKPRRGAGRLGQKEITREYNA